MGFTAYERFNKRVREFTALWHVWHKDEGLSAYEALNSRVGESLHVT
jgi:hypothetical protein